MIPENEAPLAEWLAYIVVLTLDVLRDLSKTTHCASRPVGYRTLSVLGNLEIYRKFA